MLGGVVSRAPVGDPSAIRIRRSDECPVTLPDELLGDERSAGAC